MSEGGDAKRRLLPTKIASVSGKHGTAPRRLGYVGISIL